MSTRTTFFRSMHDVGLAAWFGGNLMGAVGLNGAAAKARDPRERLQLSSIGWARWAPVQFVAMAVHGVGGIALIVDNKTRLAAQPEARRQHRGEDGGDGRRDRYHPDLRCARREDGLRTPISAPRV